MIAFVQGLVLRRQIKDLFGEKLGQPHISGTGVTLHPFQTRNPRSGDCNRLCPFACGRLLYTSDAADQEDSVHLGGRRITS